MTTTGGPEHSVAEPATSERMDGDDIVVIPDAPPDRHRRSRTLIVGGVVVALVAAGVGIAIAATRDDGQQQVQAVAPVHPAPAPTHPPNAVKKPKVPVKTPRIVAPPATAVVPPPVVVSPPVVPQTEPPVTSPPAEPTSVLQWSATPSALTVRSGGRATLTVHVVNPTDGTVTLGHPLSCPPTLRGPGGNVIGFGVCTEIAQVMNPHDELTQSYTITASNDGNALKPGNYTASVEGLYDVAVKITAS